MEESGSTGAGRAGSTKPVEMTPAEVEQLTSALQNPSRGSFPIVYEIFVSPTRKRLAYFEKSLRNLRETPAHSQTFFGPGTNRPQGDAEEVKQRMINAIIADGPNAQEILTRLSKHTERYVKLKKYFQDKIKSLGLENPLVYLDDKALRVDVGYTLKEFQAFFPDFYVDIKDHIQQDYFTSLEKEQARLSEAADVEFKKISPRKKLELKEVFSEQGFIEESLKSFQGFVLGEKHHERSAKQFLIDNLAKLKLQGVTTIYMEHLISEHHQPLIDAYLNAPEDAPLPKELEIYLAYLDKEQGVETNFTQLVKAIKKAGMRLIAIDTDASYRVGAIMEVTQLSRSETAKRCKAFNMQMVEVFRKHDDHQKFVAFVGSAHVGVCDGIPGISDLLGCPNVVIHDAAHESSTKKIEQNVEYKDALGSKANFDFLYYRDKVVKQETSGFSAGSSLVRDTLGEPEPTRIQALLKVHEEHINKSLKNSPFKLEGDKHHLINSEGHKIVFYEDGRTQSDLFTELDDINLPQKLVDDQMAVVMTLQTLFRETRGAYPKETTNLFIVTKGLSESEDKKVAEKITPAFIKILKANLLTPQFDDIRHLLSVENERLVANKVIQKLDSELPSAESPRGLVR